MDSFEKVVESLIELARLSDAAGDSQTALEYRTIAHRILLLLEDEVEADGFHDPLPKSDTLLKQGGKTFRCGCGANVFSKTRDPNYYRCNGCNDGYITGP